MLAVASAQPSRPLLLPRRRALSLAAGTCAAALGWPQPARAAHMVRPWPQAKPVPSLVLTDLAGRPWSLAAARGKVVVLNFWATWCEPCRAEMPSLVALQASRRQDKLVVCAVNYLESAEKVRSFQTLVAMPPTVLLDSDGEATAAWTPRVFPSTVMIGRDGVPVATVLGELDWMGGEAKALLDPLVAARPPA